LSLPTSPSLLSLPTSPSLLSLPIGQIFMPPFLSLSLLIVFLIIIIVFLVNKNYDIIPFLSQSLTPLQDRGKTFICESVIARALYIYIYIWPRPFSRNRPAYYRKARGKYRSNGKPEDMKEMNLFKDNDCFLDYSKMNEENFFLFENICGLLFVFSNWWHLAQYIYQ
jgi:hypothetical protein